MKGMHYCSKEESMRRILLDGEIPVNCYIIEDEGKCYIVDPGFERERLREYIQSQNLEVIGILLTHAHFDHIGALDAFDVPIYIHEAEYPILIDGYKNGFDYDDRKMSYKIEDLYIIKVNENTRIYLNKKEIEVILTPGHSSGSVCYKYDNQLITGDTLFKGSVGQWDFPTGDQEILKESIMKLIDSHDDEIEIFPAHGGTSTIGEEKINNFFYNYWKSLGGIYLDNYFDYEKFQLGRLLVDRKEFTRALEVLKELMDKGDTSLLTYMYYYYSQSQLFLKNKK